MGLGYSVNLLADSLNKPTIGFIISFMTKVIHSAVKPPASILLFNV